METIINYYLIKYMQDRGWLHKMCTWLSFFAFNSNFYQKDNLILSKRTKTFKCYVTDRAAANNWQLQYHIIIYSTNIEQELENSIFKAKFSITLSKY